MNYLDYFEIKLYCPRDRYEFDQKRIVLTTPLFIYWAYFVSQAYGVLGLELIRETNGTNIVCVQIYFRFQEVSDCREHFLRY